MYNCPNTSTKKTDAAMFANRVQRLEHEVAGKYQTIFRKTFEMLYLNLTKSVCQLCRQRRQKK